MRILALDYGDKTVGVAINDELNIMAHPLKTIFRKKATKLRQTLSEINEIVNVHNVERIIVGLPKNENGLENTRCDITREFVEKLKNRLNNSKIEVILYDERYTTLEADDIMQQLEIKKEDRKKNIDSLAASILLTSYLNEVKNGKSNI